MTTMNPVRPLVMEMDLEMVIMNLSHKHTSTPDGMREFFPEEGEEEAPEPTPILASFTPTVTPILASFTPTVTPILASFTPSVTASDGLPALSHLISPTAPVPGMTDSTRVVDEKSNEIDSQGVTSPPPVVTPTTSPETTPSGHGKTSEWTRENTEMWTWEVCSNEHCSHG